MRYVIAALIALLIVLHQDFWNWHTYEPLVLGFIPVGLAWHVGISLAAGVVGFLAVRYCWPEGLDPAAADDPAPRKGRS